jgi:hypothetical protein
MAFLSQSAMSIISSAESQRPRKFQGNRQPLFLATFLKPSLTALLNPTIFPLPTLRHKYPGAPTSALSATALATASRTCGF